jgi:putative heme iron utilization protein
MFISRLASHTPHLLSDPRASMAVSEPDDGAGDPQQLARVSLYGRVDPIGRGDRTFDPRWRVYRERFPAAERLLPLGDFGLFRMDVVSARYVGGFGRAATLSRDQLRLGAGKWIEDSA